MHIRFTDEKMKEATALGEVIRSAMKTRGIPTVKALSILLATKTRKQQSSESTLLSMAIRGIRRLANDHGRLIHLSTILGISLEEVTRLNDLIQDNSTDTTSGPASITLDEKIDITQMILKLVEQSKSKPVTIADLVRELLGLSVGLDPKT